MKNALLYFILSFVIPLISISQNLFQKTILKNSEYIITDIKQTPNGNFITCGYTLDSGQTITQTCILEINASGNILWAKSYGGQQTDWFQAILHTNDSNYIAIGGTNSFGTNGDAYIVEIDENGIIKWSKNYGSTAYDFFTFSYQTVNKEFILLGSTNSYGSYTDGNMYLVKTDSTGNIIWNKVYSNAESTTGDGCDNSFFIQTKDQGYIIGSQIQKNGITGFPEVLLKIDSLGNVKWTKVLSIDYSGSYRNIVQTKDDGFAIVNKDYATVTKLDSIGNVTWERTFNPIFYNSISNYFYFYFNNIISTIDGGFAIVGEARKVINHQYQGTYGCLIKTDSLGAFQWAKTYANAKTLTEGIELKDEENGTDGFVIIGQGESNKGFIMKTDKYGNSICDSNIVALDSLITPVATLSLSILVTSGGTSGTTNTTVNNITTTDSFLCSGMIGITKVENQYRRIEIYPNPASSTIQVVGIGNHDDVKIFDVLGKQIYQGKQTTIDISNLPNGVYFIHIGSSTQKFIVQH